MTAVPGVICRRRIYQENLGQVAVKDGKASDTQPLWQKHDAEKQLKKSVKEPLQRQEKEE